MRLIVGCLPIAGGVIGAGGEADWPQPVRSGDDIHIEGEITEVHPSRSKPDRGIVTVRVRTLNQRGEAVQNLVARLLVFRRAVTA
jgi:acyl dehydratase